jgi:L-fuconolactonase
VLLVQSQEEAADTKWLLSLTDASIAGVVGWADLEAVEEVRALAAHPRVKGLRPMVQHLEADWYDRVGEASLIAMVETGLVFDALIRPRHLASLERLASRCPGLTVVINHAAKPDSANFDSWKRRIDSIARLPNVDCKLSGLVTEDVPIAEAFAVIWQAFGPARLIWGSDWPVVNLAASHGGWLEIARSLVPAEHHDAVFGGNARQAYRLS